MDIVDFFKENIVEEKIEEVEKKKSYFFDFLNDIYYTKIGLYSEETADDYRPFNINRFVSGNMDTVLYAQEMNIRHQLDKDLQYDYYFNSIRKRKRFAKWKKNPKDKEIEQLMEFYGISYAKAKMYHRYHTKDDMKYIVSKNDKGGTK